MIIGLKQPHKLRQTRKIMLEKYFANATLILKDNNLSIDKWFKNDKKLIIS